MKTQLTNKGDHLMVKKLLVILALGLFITACDHTNRMNECTQDNTVNHFECAFEVTFDVNYW